jgi:prephenate dehydrogenase
MTTRIYERIAIVGGGLIGSSIARAARARSVVGAPISSSSRRRRWQ